MVAGPALVGGGVLRSDGRSSWWGDRGSRACRGPGSAGIVSSSRCRSLPARVASGRPRARTARRVPWPRGPAGLAQTTWDIYASLRRPGPGISA